MNIPAIEIPPAEPSGKTAPESKEPPFVLLPRNVLHHPPLRHKGDGPKVGLSVFQLAVAGACIMAATRTAADKRNVSAFQAGKRAIGRQRDALTPAGMHAAKVHDFEVGGDIIGGAGSDAYWRTRRRKTAANVEVEISRRQLLAVAGVSRNARAVRQLEPALRRLTTPVGKFSPALTSLHVGKTLRFTVVKDWLPRERFGKVPWPPPTKRGGANVAALWLLIHGMDLRPAGEMKSPPMLYETLVARLGVRKRRPAHRLEALLAALDTVNHHARALGLPAFEIEPVDDGERVRITVADDDETVQPLDRQISDDGLCADEIEERREAGRRERAEAAAAENNVKREAFYRRMAENLERLKA